MDKFQHASTIFETKHLCRRAIQSQAFMVGGVMINQMLDILVEPRLFKIGIIYDKELKACCTIDSDRMINVYVLPEHRREGIGHELVSFMLDRYRLDKSSIVCRPHDAQSAAFYRSLNLKTVEFKVHL